MAQQAQCLSTMHKATHTRTHDNIYTHLGKEAEDKEN